MSNPTPAPHTAGLRFVKLDLHLHTPASKCFQDRKATAAQIVESALRAGLKGIAVTDHNSGAWVDEVKTAAAGRLTVFPGTEITCGGGKTGIHVIALFDPRDGRAQVEGLLSSLDLEPSDYGCEETVVQKDVAAVIEKIRQRGALAVLAHANSSKGVLREMSGQQRIKVIQNSLLNAVEATDFQNAEAQSKHKRVVDLLDGSDVSLKRKIAVYQASDNPDEAGSGNHGLSGIGTRCAFFKLDRVDLDGLRQCFADPDVRIRQDFEFATTQYPRIKKIQVRGGFFDGAKANFHEGLNSILGAKGAGKSLLVEFLRFVLNQPPGNEEILADHEGKLDARLQQYGSVDVTICDETGNDVVITRVYNPAEGNPYDPTPGYDVAQLFPVLFLSQSEIIKIAESPDEQIQFIDRFFDFRAYQNEIEQLERELKDLDAELAESLRALQEVRAAEEAIGSCKAELAKLDEALKNPVFDEYTKLEGKDRTLREQSLYLTQLSDRLKASRKDFTSIAVPALPPAFASDPMAKRMANNNLQAQQLVTGKLDELADGLAAQTAKTVKDYQTWLPTFQDGKKRYEQAVQKGGGDYRILAAKRARKVKDLETLSQRLAAAKQKGGRSRDIGTRRTQALTALRAAYQQYTQERREKCKKIEQESGGRLTLTLHESTNVDEFRDRLMALKRGSRLRDAEIDRIATTVDPGVFMRKVIAFAVKADASMLKEIVEKTGIEAQKITTLADFLIAELTYEDLLGLEYQVLPEDRPEIRFRVAENRYETLDRLSVGQKCTAMLIIALSDGTMPIAIDQPEDSLDIRSVWEDICTKIRRGKEHRQFIFTTHNSSLAVASDSDKFIIVEGTADAGRVVFSGSMDRRPISDEVLKYLEGGVPTYRRKYDKYRADELLKSD